MEKMLDYEKKHIDYLLNNAHEGTLFLKRDQTFPISKPCKTVLVGNGARQTIKGGTGSGDVASRFFTTFEQGLEEAGFEITSKEWLDKYDEYKKSTLKQFIKETKKISWKKHTVPGMFSMGYFEEEKNYPFEVSYDGELCVYVLARNSGEGNDRRNIEGDIKLSKKEISDIRYLNQKFKKFLLVLNVGGVVDLSPVVTEVKNILYISQLGVVTGTILPRIILGKCNPSGKLTTTWAKSEDYPFFEEFGDQHDTYYKEGIYVGYRYFNSEHIQPLFAFGYGLSYTNFALDNIDVTLDKTTVNININVKNTGMYSGKEVVQVYVSSPQGRLDKPYQTLAAFKKTDLLKHDEEQKLNLKFNLEDLASYDEKEASYLLEKGNYIVRVGNASDHTEPVVNLSLAKDVIIKKCQNQMGKSGFEDYHANLKDETITNIKTLKINPSDFKEDIVTYKKDVYRDPFVEQLKNEELVLLCLGAHKTSKGAVVGNSSVHLIGGAGETTLSVPTLNKSLTMADGPAGLRLTQTYGKDEKGIYNITLDPIMEKMKYFLPKMASLFINPPKNRHGTIYHQYTTAIPIGTSLAMSFNEVYVYELGKLIGEEMDTFKVDLWLAPALNIHRSIRCGRNFEYYAEDPLVSGKIASAITKGVQEKSTRGVTIKHFCCNNQELNRNNNNSHVSERAIREIYLRGFETCIKESSPRALMTSYNLINGVHTSESYSLINNILRNEWHYQGLVMTDWITSGVSWCFASKYKAPYADNNILAGNDLTMAGSKRDEKYLFKALQKGKITRDDLINSASRIYRTIKEQKN